jgi:8-oxo-dGTP diphosphatase
MPLQSHRNYYTVVTSGYIILERDGKIPMLRRFNTGYQDGNYGLPAGHLEAGEMPTAGTVREVVEEIGVDLKSEELSIVHIMYRHCSDHERVDFFFTAKNWSGEVTNVEPHRCDDVSWFPLDNLPENTVPYIKTALDNYRAGTFYSEEIDKTS